MPLQDNWGYGLTLNGLRLKKLLNFSTPND